MNLYYIDRDGDIYVGPDDNNLRRWRASSIYIGDSLYGKPGCSSYHHNEDGTYFKSLTHEKAAAILSTIPGPDDNAWDLKKFPRL